MVVVTPRAFQTYGDPYDSALTADGKIVLVGYANDNTPTPTRASSFAMRFNSDGSLDSSFGSGGRTMIDHVAGYQFGRGVAIDPGGRTLVLSQYEYATSQYSTMVSRLTPGGAIDPTWSGGTRTIEFGNPPNSTPSALRLQPDGKLLVAGYGVQQRVALARLLTADDPAAPAAPTIAIKSPAKRSLKASKLRTISGTAGPAGAVKKVEIALQRKDSKLLKKKRRCLWLSSAKAKFKKIKASKGKCGKPSFRKATGTTSWKYRLTKKLPVGSYALTARVTLTDGRTATKTYSFKLKKR